MRSLILKESSLPAEKTPLQGEGKMVCRNLADHCKRGILAIIEDGQDIADQIDVIEALPRADHRMGNVDGGNHRRKRPDPPEYRRAGRYEDLRDPRHLPMAFPDQYPPQGPGDPPRLPVRNPEFRRRHPMANNRQHARHWAQPQGRQTNAWGTYPPRPHNGGAFQRDQRQEAAFRHPNMPGPWHTKRQAAGSSPGHWKFEGKQNWLRDSPLMQGGVPSNPGFGDSGSSASSRSQKNSAGDSSAARMSSRTSADESENEAPNHYPHQQQQSPHGMPPAAAARGKRTEMKPSASFLKMHDPGGAAGAAFMDPHPLPAFPKPHRPAYGGHQANGEDEARRRKRSAMLMKMNMMSGGLPARRRGRERRMST